MTRILFIDDEANVLNGLRRMLRPMRNEWDMVFVNSGEKALAFMEGQFLDIIVSDLRMPGMDGVELLEEVRRRSPQTVRIALSGHADKTSTLRAVTQIHQFISKPCEPDVLKEIISRAIGLGQTLTDPRLKGVVAQMKTLPSLSRLYDNVVEELDSPDASAGEIGERIAKDAGMSSKVLQLVNSALIGMPQIVGDPVQATVLLGLETVRTLVLSVKIFDEFLDEDLCGLSHEAVWQHSVNVARLAKRIALAEDANEHVAECAFLSGLLHDTGKFVFAANMPERYGSVLKLGDGDPLVTDRVERKVMGATHGEVGGYLMGLWGFSETIIEAIMHHHVPSAAPERGFHPLTAVHVANVLVRQSEKRRARKNKSAPPAYSFDTEYLERLNMADRIPLWTNMAGASIAATEKTL